MEPLFVIYLPMIASMGANHFILILSINLGVDILYAYVDPRIRLA